MITKMSTKRIENNGISVREIVVSYPSRPQPVLENLSLEIPAGCMNVLIGPNGCGKSTLLKALARQLRLASGSIWIGDQNLDEMSTVERSRKIGILFQENFAPNDLTVEELVFYSRYTRLKLFESLREEDCAAVENALRMTNTLDWRNRPIRELSSGQRQLVWIALLIAQETEYLFLDEPTTYLDMPNQLEILDCIRRLNAELGKTVVISIHDINMAALYADYLFAMRDGKICSSGKLRDVLTPQLLRDVFDVEAKIHYDEQNGTIFCLPCRKRRK
ncbi:MAG: ABC transporter ATP-binding protein [Planctomycetia bacterium]|nr:ABC transporter ATP-binding protein [Planctomycetia bacterium]